MEKKTAIIISPNFGDYAKKYLADCVASIRDQLDAGVFKVFLIDNATTEESFNYLRSMVPEAEIIRNVSNDGFAKGNNDAMKAALSQGYEYIFLVNMDTVVERDCLRRLIETAENDPRSGVVQARLMLWPEKDKINSIGNDTHFLGFGYCVGYNDDVSVHDLESIDQQMICYPAGAAVLIRAEILRKIGLFDEVFWMYNEDQDLGWRAWLAGWRCILASRAVVYHKYEFSRSIQKFYWMDRNRIISMLKNYHVLTIILVLPAFMVMELGLFFFSIKNGWWRDKLRVYKYFLDPKNWHYLVNGRKTAQAIRSLPDREIVKFFSGKIWYQEISSNALKIGNIFFNIYWQIAKRLIIW